MTPGPWTISEVRTVDGHAMIVGGEGQQFGLIAEVTNDQDAALIIRAFNRDAQFEAMKRSLKNSADALDYCLSVLPKDELLRTKVEVTRNAARKALADIGEATSD